MPWTAEEVDRLLTEPASAPLPKRRYWTADDIDALLGTTAPQLFPPRQEWPAPVAGFTDTAGPALIPGRARAPEPVAALDVPPAPPPAEPSGLQWTGERGTLAELDRMSTERMRRQTIPPAATAFTRQMLEGEPPSGALPPDQTYLQGRPVGFREGLGQAIERSVHRWVFPTPADVYGERVRLEPGPVPRAAWNAIRGADALLARNVAELVRRIDPRLAAGVERIAEESEQAVEASQVRVGEQRAELARVEREAPLADVRKLWSVPGAVTMAARMFPEMLAGAATGRWLGDGGIGFWATQGMGDTYPELRERGFSPAASAVSALALAFPYALIEKLQVERILSPTQAQAVKQGIARAALRTLGRSAVAYATDVATNVAQEGLQRAITDAGQNIAAFMDNDPNLKGLGLGDFVRNSSEEMRQATPGMLLLIAPGAAAQTAQRMAGAAVESVAAQPLAEDVLRRKAEAGVAALTPEQARAVAETPPTRGRVPGETRAEREAVVEAAKARVAAEVAEAPAGAPAMTAEDALRLVEERRRQNIGPETPPEALAVVPQPEAPVAPAAEVPPAPPAEAPAEAPVQPPARKLGQRKPKAAPVVEAPIVAPMTAAEAEAADRAEAAAEAQRRAEADIVATEPEPVAEPAEPPPVAEPPKKRVGKKAPPAEIPGATVEVAPQESKAQEESRLRAEAEKPADITVNVPDLAARSWGAASAARILREMAREVPEFKQAPVFQVAYEVPPAPIRDARHFLREAQAELERIKSDPTAAPALRDATLGRAKADVAAKAAALKAAENATPVMRLVFRDNYRYTFPPESLGLKSEDLKEGMRVRVDFAAPPVVAKGKGSAPFRLRSNIVHVAGEWYSGDGKLLARGVNPWAALKGVRVEAKPEYQPRIAQTVAEAKPVPFPTEWVGREGDDSDKPPEKYAVIGNILYPRAQYDWAVKNFAIDEWRRAQNGTAVGYSGGEANVLLSPMGGREGKPQTRQSVADSIVASGPLAQSKAPKKRVGRRAGPAAEPAQARTPLPSEVEPAKERKGFQRVPRIPIAPEKAEAAKRPRELVYEIGRTFGNAVRAAHVSRSLGKYAPSSARVAIRFHGDVDTASHEVAHSIDDALRVMPPLYEEKPNRAGVVMRKLTAQGAAMRAELESLWQHGSVTQTGPRSRLDYKMGEAFAEWVRAYIVNPAAVRQQAPQLTAYILSKLPADTVAGLNTVGADVRAWAGLSDINKVAAQIEMKPRDKGLWADLRRRYREGASVDFEVTWLDKLKVGAIDALWPYWKAIAYAKGLRGISEQDPKTDAYVLGRIFAGIDAFIHDQFDRGPVDFAAEAEGRSKRVAGVGGLDWLLAPLDAETKESINNEILLTAVQLVAERTIEKGKQFAERGLDADRIMGIGAGVFDDRSVAQRALDEFKALPDDKRARIEEAARRYRAFADAMVLRPLVETGRITRGQYAAIKGSNEFYVDTHRVMDDRVGLPVTAAARKRLGAVRNPLARFLGSTRPIGNPYVNLMVAAGVAQREARRNQSLRAFRDLLTAPRRMYEGDPKHLAAIGYRATSKDADTIRVFVDGKAEYWKFEKGIHEALKGWGQLTDQNPWWRMARVPGRVLRAAVVHSPGFAVRNVIRDAQHRQLVSRYASDILDIRYPTEDQVSDLYRAGGGLAGWYGLGPTAYYDALETAIHHAREDKHALLVLDPRNLWRGYVHLLEKSEQFGRVAEFTAVRKKLLAQGMDEVSASMRAALEARDVLDFAQAGTVVGWLNQVVPFTNASVQGLFRTYTAAKELGPTFWARWGVYVLLPTLATYAWNARDDESEYEYARLPMYQRAMFWNYRIGDEVWLRIPKPYEMGVLSSSAERLIDRLRGNERAFDGFQNSMARAFFPVDDQALLGPLRPVAETIANYDFFRGRQIVPYWETRRPVGMRAGAQRASRMGQVIEKASGERVDARMVEHLINSYLGDWGKIAGRLSDLGREDREQRFARDLNLLFGLVVPPPPPGLGANETPRER